MHQQQSLNDLQRLQRILKRRRGWLVAPFVITLLLAVVLALALPNIYRSTATILIKDKRIPEDLVPSTVSSYAEERVQAITQEVMSRTRILQLAEKHDLLGAKRHTLSTDTLVEKIKKRIAIEPVNAEVNTGRSNRPVTLMIAFRLAYEDESPQKAQAVTNEIASYYLEKNLESREKVARGTTAFLQEQMEQVKKRITGLEDQLAAYRKAHLEQLPEFTQLNMQKLEKLNADIVNINMQLRNLEEQRASLRTQLASLDPYAETASGQVLSPQQRLQLARMERAQLVARYSEKHPLVQAKNREIALLEKSAGGSQALVEIRRRIRELEGQLAALSSKYTADHPKVRKVRNELERLRADLGYVEGAAAQGDSPRSTQAPSNPAYVNLKAELAKTEVSIRSFKQERKRLEAQVQNLYEKLRAMPEVAKTYNSLETDLQLAKAHYQELQEKFLAAKVSQSMEEDRLGETFEVIEPAYLPGKPARPNRLAIVLVGIVLGLGLAMGLTALREFSDPRLYDREDLEQAAGMPVLSLIPTLETEEDRRRRRRRRLATAAACLGGLVAALWAFHLWVMDWHIFYAKLLRLLEGKFFI
ncbi:Uncharacterized protein involved in exopolysaccharide biosynthesis [Desulfacinum hydrothermale DSM 13146]|uniref:Uncharacterized protein involved in exopolysaccharide biosynthesis n=1 Tax=Desulfacinum hydrothermale DSM 13146 TaxID=1121390 RepID=A0A1W1XT53_9BACT|nr:Wzz/FepE/Etk N-terminal domain-containing protein [Desulfacinum hydrothermale]SMC26731.1 Uncharacterized protein involved in exopolysaccharide biosynthesis [Desulfacinum hydrothermale DSM 13146]